MLTAGNYQILTVSRISDYGLYLTDGEDNEVLFPNRYVSINDKIGDSKRVFIYHDSENRLVATTEKPYAVAGEAAYLEVVDKNVHGVFLDWGIPAKDLFMPKSNQQINMEAGKKYIVYIYTDNISGRAVATTRLNSYISNTELTVASKDEVDILVAKKLDMGYRVIINNRHWGMLYDNQIFREVYVGDRFKAYVRKVTDDNRIDVSLQQEGFDEVKVSAEKLRDIIEANGGTLALNDKSAPEEVTEMTRMSKKVFKRSLGYLLSHSIVELLDDKIKLLKQ